MQTSTKTRIDPVHVAAAVLTDAEGRVLLSRRATDAHQGGLWEFPGGKVDSGEDVQSALRREVDEELGVLVENARPLIRVPHEYRDRNVLLDVWKVTSWRGDPRGLENQEIDWVSPEVLPGRDFPAADVPVVAAVRLPECHAITPAPSGAFEPFLEKLDRLTAGNISLVQLRAHELDQHTFAALARAAARICQSNDAQLILNGDPQLAVAVGADGVHLTSARLRSLSSRPLNRSFWVGASCHDAFELEHAARIGADFALLSPVNATPGQGKAPPLGWDGFRPLAEAARLPVYALGGLGPQDAETAWAHGAQGVAAVRGFWPPD
ncbi:MAG TPA: Nudix family hydrolase [Gammaproteobacteria bacterium]|nr:Nudix family hydrolase [Gammaproteobacteria bacterium]